MFTRNRDVFKKKQELEFFKRWRDVAPDNIHFQSEVEKGIKNMEIELKKLETKNKKWNKLFN